MAIIIIIIINAVMCIITGILQFASFGVMKEGLTRRMRSATMKHLMRMEVGYHDDPGHTPSKNVFALELCDIMGCHYAYVYIVCMIYDTIVVYYT